MAVQMKFIVIIEESVNQIQISVSKKINENL